MTNEAVTEEFDARADHLLQCTRVRGCARLGERPLGGGAAFNGLGVVWLTSYALPAARGRNLLNPLAVRRATV